MTLKIRIKIRNNEAFYGIGTVFGASMPLTEKIEFSFDQRREITQNQEASFLVSSLGSYIFSPEAISVSVKDGTITVEGEQIEYEEGNSTLKEGYLEACNRFFKPNGKIPPSDFFKKPQYNTWVELIYDQTQAGVIKYAEGILNNGLPAGIIMIDDGWQRYYGSRDFKREFPDVEEMNRILHDMGFKTMLWVCPFVSLDSEEFRYLDEKGLLLKDKNGVSKIVKWWNGYSAVLDLTNPETEKYALEYLGSFTDRGFDGFKFDAGDPEFYMHSDNKGISPHGHCRLWSLLSEKFPYNELRSSYNTGGMTLVQRLCDKPHRWDSVSRLVPDLLCQGIMGYFYGCPDMIGGGSFTDFLPGAPTLDPELFVRYAQVASLMPMLQYSCAPWRVLDKEHAELCIEAGKLHERFADKIIALAQNASVTGEPIARYMEYEFPHNGYESVTDQFMLGKDILVAPVCEKGVHTRKVILPNGNWKYIDGIIYRGSTTVTVDAPLSALPYFEKVN